MSVTYFRRNPYADNFSIEEIFNTLEANLPDDFEFCRKILPCKNNSVAKIVKNLFFAYRNRGYINHITGDVHYLALVLPKKNTILTIHDCSILERSSGIKKKFLWFFWYYWPSTRAKYITVVSLTTKNNLLKHVKLNPEKVRVIHNCLTASFKIKTSSFNKIKPRILQVGIMPHKNQGRMFKALENIPCTLVIIGKPVDDLLLFLNDKHIDYELYNELSREEVINLYSSSDLLLYVSLIEGFGLPIIEAQATGLAVITSNLSSMPEIAGNGACFANPLDVNSIRESVIKVIEDDDYRNEIICNGFINVKRFDPKKLACEYANLYQECQLVSRTKT